MSARTVLRGTGVDLSASHLSLLATLTQVEELPLGWQAYVSNTQPGQTEGQHYITDGARRVLAQQGVEWLRAAGFPNPRPCDTVPPYLQVQSAATLQRAPTNEWLRCYACAIVGILRGQPVK